MKENNPHILGTEKVGKLLLEYSIPAIIGMTLTSLYNIIDSVFIGHGVGAMAISGLAISFPLMNLLVAFCTLVGVGGATISSIRLGQKDTDGAEKVLGNVTVLCVINSIFYGGITLLFLDRILFFFGASHDTLPYARDFMQIILIGSPVTYVMIGLNNIMRATGYPRKAMLSSMLTVGCNIILAPVFIFWLGWGIRGAATATILSQFAGMIWVLSHFMQEKSYIRFKKGIFKLRKRIVENIFSIGMSPFLMNVCASAIVIIFNKSLLLYGGDLAIGAYGILNRLLMLFVMVIMGLTMGMQPIVGYNHGAHKFGRVKQTLKYCMIAGGCITSLGFAFSELFPNLVVNMFTDDKELTALARTGLQIGVLMFPFVGIQIVISSFFQSIGKAKISIFLSLSRQLLYLLPCLLLLPHWWGLNGIWLSMPVSDLSKTGYRFGIPTLLVFLLVGMLFGSDGLGLQFHDAGEAQFIGMMALSIILFSGGMDTKYSDIKPVLPQGILLSTFGVLLTTIFTGFFIYWISGFSNVSITMSLMTAMLLAATMSSTDSASVFNILRSQSMNLKHNLRPMLELESGSNDPMAYMLTIVLIQFITSAGMGADDILISFLIQFAVGGTSGFLLGKLAVAIINKIDLKNQSLYPILLLSFIFFTFTMTDLCKGNGYLAVYIAGMMVGNARIVNRKEIATFMSGMTWLFQIIMFLSLGLLVNPHEMLSIAIPATLIGIFMIVLARPLSVLLCLLPFKKMNINSRLFISWVGLRGAVPIIFATYPVVADVPGSTQIFNIVFFITILSLVVQGTTISWMAKLLHLDTPLEKTGNDFGVEIPEEINTDLRDIVLTEEMLAKGNRLMDMNLPKGMLVMLIKRGNEFMIPNGSLQLHAGDKLLIISESKTK